MLTTIPFPPETHPAWCHLSEEERESIRQHLQEFTLLPDRPGLSAGLRDAAKRLGCHPNTLAKKYYALRDSGGDWTCLIDKRRGSRR